MMRLMPRWTNWSGKLTAEPEALHFARTEDDLSALVAATAARNGQLRVVGAAHSHQPLIPTNDTIVDLGAFNGLIDVDTASRVARIRAGTPIHALGPALHRHGLALGNQGDIDRQSLGGAIATGTHGTGRTLPSLSAMVRGVRLVTATGDVIETAESGPDVLEASRLHLGALGVVTEIDIEVLPAYRLAENGWAAAYGDLRPDIESLAESHRHFEFFWFPQNDQAIAKTIDSTDAELSYPMGDEGTRVGWSFEVLPNHRPVPHTEMEFSVDVEQGPACLDAIVELIRSQFTDLEWPVEYRTVAADDVWLSTAHGRPVATISVHQAVELDDEPLFRACESVFREFGGRPHWGKVNWFSGDDHAAGHSRWTDWCRVRAELDPTAVFCNDNLAALVGIDR